MFSSPPSSTPYLLRTPAPCPQCQTPGDVTGYVAGAVVGRVVELQCPTCGYEWQVSRAREAVHQLRRELLIGPDRIGPFGRMG